MRKDSRGRVRMTVKGIRYEINKDGVLRAYARDIAGQDTERATGIDLTPLKGRLSDFRLAFLTAMY